LVLLPTKIAVKAFVIRSGRFAFQNYWVQSGKLPHRVFSRTYGVPGEGMETSELQMGRIGIVHCTTGLGVRIV